MGWIGASILFYGVCGLLGGPTEGDASETVYGTWAVAHGSLACVYPPMDSHHLVDIADPFTLAAPLYPLITGAFAAIFRIGQSVPFPSSHQLGYRCINAFNAMFHWSVSSSAILPTVHLAYLVWPILVISVIALLRATGRTQKRWEPFTLSLLALTPPVAMCITYYFHPMDILAVALTLAGAASALSKRWFWAGVLLALAFASQQFALLVGVPLLVIIPASGRPRYVAGAILTAIIVDAPLIIATSGRAVKTVLLGSSRVGSDIRSRGGTVLWEVNMHGIPLFLVSRVLPILAAFGLAWWASRKLGTRMLSPVPFVSLIATCLVFRLVFEVNLFGYYFMATAVSLVILEVVTGQLRGSTFAWLALLTVALNPVHEGFVSNLTSWSLDLYEAIPIVLFVLMCGWVLYDAKNRHFRAYKFAWILIVLLTSESRLWGSNLPLIAVQFWFWQVILVPTAIALAITPLLATIKSSKVVSTSRLGVAVDR